MVTGGREEQNKKSLCLTYLHMTTKYMCFNQRGNISTLNGSSLKLVDKFTYLESSVSITETEQQQATSKSMDSY